MKPDQFPRRIEPYQQLAGHDKTRVRRSDSAETLFPPVVIVILRKPGCWALAIPEAESVLPLYARTIGRAQTVLSFSAKTLSLRDRFVGVSEPLHYVAR